MIFSAKHTQGIESQTVEKEFVQEAFELIADYELPSIDSQKGRDERFELGHLYLHVFPDYFASIGDDASRIHSLRKSVELFRELAQDRFQDHARYWPLLQDGYYRLGEREQALEAQSRVIELNPSSLWEWIHVGNLQWDLGKREEAIGSYTKATEILPHEAAGWAHRGLRYSQLRQFEQAIEDLSRGIELNPNDAGYWHWRGDAYRESGRHAEAIEDYSKSLELNTLQLWSWIHRGSSRLALGQLDSALEDYRKAREISMDKTSGAEAEIQQKLGEIATRQGRYEEAIDHFDKSIAITPKAGYRYKRRAVACFQASRFDDALADLRTARQLNPEDLSTLTWIAPHLLATCPSEDFKMGLLELADRAVKRNVEARSFRAVIAINLGLFEKARMDMSVVAESDKATYYELYQIAMLSLVEPRDEAAYRATCQQMFDRFSDSTDPLAVAFVGWTCALLPNALEDLIPVKEFVQRMLDAHPDDAELRRSLGALQVRLGEFTTAVETLMRLASSGQTADEAKSSNAYPLYFLALAQFGAEQRDQALQTLEHVLQLTESELSQSPSLAWNRKLTLELLLNEATKTIQPKGE